MIMDTEDYRKKIELEILQIIEDKLKSHQMDATRAKEIARYVLDSLHPNMNINEIYETVQNFDDHFSELIPVVLKVSKDYDERVKKAVVDHITALLKQGKVDEANILLKKATNKEIKLKE